MLNEVEDVFELLSAIEGMWWYVLVYVRWGNFEQKYRVVRPQSRAK